MLRRGVVPLRRSHLRCNAVMMPMTFPDVRVVVCPGPSARVGGRFVSKCPVTHLA